MLLSEAAHDVRFSFEGGKWWYRPPSGGRHPTACGTCKRCGGEWVRPIRQKYTYDFCSKDCQRASISENAARATCHQCGIPFQRKPSQLSDRTAVFCSRRCQHAHQAKDGVVAPCAACGKSFRVPQCYAKRGAKYCSPECHASAAKGAGSKGFRGYVGWRGKYLCYTPSHPVHPNRSVHGVLWRENNPDGRCERCGDGMEHVHHRDGNPANNELANLEGVCASCHIRHHLAEGMGAVTRFRKGQRIRTRRNTRQNS